MASPTDADIEIERLIDETEKSDTGVLGIYNQIKEIGRAAGSCYSRRLKPSIWCISSVHPAFAFFLCN